MGGRNLIRRSEARADGWKGYRAPVMVPSCRLNEKFKILKRIAKELDRRRYIQGVCVYAKPDTGFAVALSYADGSRERAQ